MLPLQHFFTTIWARHYQAAEQAPCDLFQLYDNAWDQALSQQFPAWRTQPAEIAFPLPTPTLLLNPCRWLANHVTWSRLYGLRQAVVHGDFHGDNLLVDRSYYPWIIDFEHTGKGHILRDFAEITQDLLTRIAEWPEGDLTLLYELAIVLVKPTRPTQPLLATQRIAENSEASKAFDVLKQLYRLAHRQTHYCDCREFLWSLLFDTLFVATLPRKTEAIQQKSLLFGAVLAQRLHSWCTQPWPLEHWPAVQWLPTQTPLLSLD